MSKIVNRYKRKLSLMIKFVNFSKKEIDGNI